MCWILTIPDRNYLQEKRNAHDEYLLLNEKSIFLVIFHLLRRKKYSYQRIHKSTQQNTSAWKVRENDTDYA